MNSNISNKDKKDWENFLSKNESLPNKDSRSIEKKKLRPIVCDLHGYSLDDANKKIEDLIRNCYKNGFKKLIIVTGKGLHSDNVNDPYVSKDLGILKYSVPEYIKNNKALMSLIIEIKEASLEDGGSGAFYIYLKKKL
ncbi:Smr/MutS family protein [Pelagibacterales bacterium SAG-MED39]|nr:Smr/MutS family protein [Pelagibacterales bacterium SAG-MED39]